MRFRSARELFAALEAPDPVERRRLLGWVASHPSECSALGAHGGRDAIDVIIGLADTDRDYGYWEDAAVALGAFDDPRVTEFFIGMLERSNRAEAAFDAATALSHRDRSGLRERLLAVLLGGGPPERAVAVSELLADEPELPVEAEVRVAIMGADRPPPALTDAAVAVWMRELAGPFGAQARERLEEQGEPALRALGERPDGLDADDRAWLVEWEAELRAGEESEPEATAPGDPDEVNELVRRLTGDSAEERAEARDAIVAHGAVALERLRPLTRSSREEVRAAAVRALLDLGDDDWLAAELLDPD